MISHSIIRGYGMGIGEAPGRKVPPGEQYLYACPELWKDPVFAEKARPWLTVDFEPLHRNDRGNRLEVWSCFGVNGFQFVARGVVIPTSNGDKPQYFTHARAWPESVLDAGQDPGALIGVSRAFQAPNLPPMHSDPPELAMTWGELLRAEKEIAIRLLSQIHAARLTNRPVIIWAAPELLSAGGRLANLLAFARAALPLQLKRGFQIRIYTRKPELFLRELGAGLVVVLSFDAERAMKACPGAMLLAGDGHPMDPADMANDAYAKGVVGRALEFPQHLFEFSVRFKPTFPARAATVIYNFSAVKDNPQLLDELLEFVYRRPASANTPLPWEDIIGTAIWSQFSTEMLRKLVLIPPSTVDNTALAACIRAELRRRQIRLDDELATPENSGLTADVSFVRDLFMDGLITGAVAVGFVQQIDATQILAYLSDERLLGAIVASTGESKVPASWQSAIFHSPDAYRIALRILGQVGPASSWQAETYQLLYSLLSADRPIPSDFPKDSQLFPEPPDIQSALIQTELLYRSLWNAAGKRAPSGFDVLRAAGLDRFRDRGQRNWLLQQVLRSPWSCLTGFRPPVRWTEEASLLPPPDDIAGIDQAMLRRMRETTADLLATGRWLTWRRASELPRDKLREAGLTWLVDPYPNRSWDEWKIVIKDVQRIAEHRIRKQSDVRRPPWPWIPGHEAEQVDDLLTLASNDDARNALRELDPRLAATCPAPAPPKLPAEAAGAAKLVPPPRTVGPASFRTVTVTESIIAQILQSLTNSGTSDEVWQSVEAEMLRAVAKRIRAGDPRLWIQLELSGWKVFERECRRHAALLQPCGGVLPALELAAVLRSGESMVFVARNVIELARTAQLETPDWWVSLLAGLEDMPRRSGQPHPRDHGPSTLTAVAAIEKQLPEAAQKALQQARKQRQPMRTTAPEALPPPPSAASRPEASNRKALAEADSDEQDPQYEEAVLLIRQMGKASTSTLQRHLRVGYGRAARILDMMHKNGIVGPPNGSRPREVLKQIEFSVPAKPAEPVTSAAQNKDLVEDVLHALARGDTSAHCWKELDRIVGLAGPSYEDHPWVLIARRTGPASAVVGELKKNAWKTLRRVLPVHEVLMQMPAIPKGQTAQMPLPARTAVAALRPGICLEDVVGDLVLMDLNSRQLESPGWWSGVLHGLPADAVHSLCGSLAFRLRLKQREAMQRATKVIE